MVHLRISIQNEAHIGNCISFHYAMPICAIHDDETQIHYSANKKAIQGQCIGISKCYLN